MTTNLMAYNNTYHKLTVFMGPVSGYRLAGSSALSLIRLKSGCLPGLQFHLRLRVYFKLANFSQNLVLCISSTKAFSI